MVVFGSAILRYLEEYVYAIHLRGEYMGWMELFDCVDGSRNDLP